MAAGPSSTRVALALALVAIGALGVAAVVSAPEAPAGAARAGRAVDLGVTPRPTAPVCPENCRAIGRVTGFQVRAEGGEGKVDRLPFRVPFDAWMTSWTLDLARPTDAQRAFFTRLFGGPPRARISVLRRGPRTSPPRYRLRRQGPPRFLSDHLGDRVRFRLRPALRVERGDIIALTVPTWAPAFAIDIPKGNRWRGSRRPRRCLKARDQARGRSHQIPRTARVYGCTYETARLLYSARLVRR